MSKYRHLNYSITNEDLHGIVLGMNLSLNDSVLAVAGSGDQALAILEFVRNVTAVDSNRDQIKLAREKINTLLNGNYSQFLNQDLLGAYDGYFLEIDSPEFAESKRTQRNNYFLDDPNRLKNIRQKLGALVIAEPCDVGIDFLTLGPEKRKHEFNKMYLSNISITSTLQFLPFVSAIPVGGLIYVTDHKTILKYSSVNFPKDNRKSDCNEDKHKDLYDGSFYEGSFLHPKLEIDFELSMKARTNGNSIWTPAVYKRIK